MTVVQSQTFRITTLGLSFSTNVFIRLPNNSDMAWDRYVAPCSYGLWLALAIAACAVAVCLALQNYGHQRNQTLSLSAILFYIHACICQQGQTDESRFIFLLLYVFCCLITQFNFSLLFCLNLCLSFHIFLCPASLNRFY
jgi:hypothetical protein